MKLIIHVILLLVFVIVSFDFKNDDSAVDSKQMDANSISTWFRSNGSFNRDPGTGNSGFYWPISTSNTARYASGFWIGARTGNDTLITVCNYEYEYLPGYTDLSGNPQGFDSGDVYKIYKLTKDINNKDRTNWPNSLLGNSNQGAPVYYDNVTSSWKPQDFGFQTMFYLFTDSYPSVHTAVGGSTAPLKADIKQLNIAERNISGAMYNTIVSQYIIINRNTVPWEDAYFSFWTDDDLGSSEDDVKGCDSALRLGYTYNFTNNDPVYGANPPCVGTILLKGALKHTGNPGDIETYCVNNVRIVKTGYRDQGLYSFSSNGYPANKIESYRLMNGIRADGSTVMNPGGFPTRLYYTGDPVTGTGWIQTTAGNQRFLLTTGPVDVNPGDTQVIVIAQMIARGSSNLNSITQLRGFAADVKEYYRDCYNLSPLSVEGSDKIAETYFLDQNFPNPFNPSTMINYSLPENSYVNLKVYDILGKEVSVLVNEAQKAGGYSVQFNGSGLASGIYIYRLEAGKFSSGRRMLLVK